MGAETILAGVVGFGLFLILVFSGIPIAFCALISGVVGLSILTGTGKALDLVGYTFIEETAKFAYGVVVFFVLMGYLIFNLGIADEVYRAARAWVGHLPGGLAMATSLACAFFGAASGSSNAAAAIFAKVAVPEMIKYNYDGRLATGTVATAGTLASLIPPSALIVIYGILSDTSIARTLIAGVIPGFFIAGLFMLMIWLRAMRNPKLGPPLPPVSWKERIVSLNLLWPIIVTMLVIIGGMYSGIFTPTEAGAMGAFSILLIGLVLRRLRWSPLMNSLLETLRISTMIFIVVVCVKFLMQLLAFSGVTLSLGEYILSLQVHRLTVLVLMTIVYLILGCFIGTMGMLMITVPIFCPIAFSLKFDPVWFGIYVIIMCEIALVTPPVGMNAYIVNRVYPQISLQDVFKGCVPFIIVLLFAVVFFVVFPSIVTWLPQQMMGS